MIFLKIIPMLSIISFVSLIPAVSETTTGYPSILRNISITSLVVPAISETIAVGSTTNKFNKDDLPAFTSPIIDTLKPSLIFSPI